MKQQIPNLLTLTNLFCGCLAIVFMLNGHLFAMFLAVVIGEVADLLDGFAARALKVETPMGESLDSHADMVSFGVVPGMGMYLMLLWSDVPEWMAYGGFIVTLFCCLRLSQFETEESRAYFHGLATPSTTAFIIGLLLTAHYNSLGLREYILQPVFLFAVIAVFSYLMLSNIPTFNMKFKNFSWRDNKIRYIFTIVCTTMCFVIEWAALPIGMIFYIILSVFFTEKHYAEEKA